MVWALTSSRDKACLKVLMELLELVKGSVLDMITPILATVSLYEYFVKIAYFLYFQI